jgi:RNA polymerase sigma factor (sigma-70 family)
MTRLRKLLRFAQRQAAAALEPADDQSLLRRYAADRDEAAFTALIERRGPLVLAVCRRALGDPHLADDAFQATFLIVARHAGRLARSGSLAGWLHVVAARVAGRLAKRRARHSLQPLTTDPPGPTPTRRIELDECLHILDEELARLPARYRGPLVSCYLLERTQEEAARDLGWGLNTLRRRLAIGRELLRARLLARGTALSPTLLAAAVAATAGAVPAMQVVTEVLQLAPAAAARGPLPGRLAGLVECISIGPGRWLTGLAIALGFGLVVAGAVLWPESAPPAAPIAIVAYNESRTQSDQLGDGLPAGAIARMGSVRFRHPQPASLAFTADGRAVIAVGGESVRTWDAETGSPQLRFGWRRTVRPGKFGSVQRAAFGPDMALLWVAEEPFTGENPSLVQWDLANGQVVRSVRPAEPKTRDVFEVLATSPDGRIAAEVYRGQWNSGQQTYHVRLRDATTGQLKHSLPTDLIGDLPRNPIAVAFGPGGTTLVTVDEGPRVQIWDAASGQYLRSFGRSGSVLAGAVLAPNGAWLATICNRRDKLTWRQTPEGVVQVWDFSTGAIVRELRTDGIKHLNYPVMAFSFTEAPAGLAMIWGSNTAGFEVCRWRLADGVRTAHWSRPDVRSTVAAAVSPDGRAVAVSGMDDAVRVYDLDTGRERVVAPDAHPGPANDVAFHPDGQTLVTAGPEAVRTWVVHNGRPLTVLPLPTDGHAGPNRLDSTGRWVSHSVTRAGRTQIVIRDTLTGLPHPSVAKPANGRFLDDGAAYVEWIGRKARPPFRVLDLDESGAARTVRPVRLITRGPVGGEPALDDTQVVVWDVRSGALVSNWAAALVRGRDPLGRPDSPRPDTGLDSAVSRDGQSVYLLVWYQDGSAVPKCGVHRYDAATGQFRWRQLFPHIYSVLAVSPDGTRVAVGGPDIVVLDAETLERVGQFDPEPGKVTSLRFSPDGKRLASTGTDGTAIVWDVSRR